MQSTEEFSVPHSAQHPEPCSSSAVPTARNGHGTAATTGLSQPRLLPSSHCCQPKETASVTSLPLARELSCSCQSILATALLN